MTKAIKSINITMEDGSEVTMPFGEFVHHLELFQYNNSVIDDEEERIKIWGVVDKNTYLPESEKSND